MSVASATAGMERIVPRSTATALAVLAHSATAGTGTATPLARVSDVGASSTGLALLGQRAIGTATGFPWSRARNHVATPSRHP